MGAPGGLRHAAKSKKHATLCVVCDSACCRARPTFPAVCRQLLAVADSLLSLAAAASRVLSSGHVPTWLPMQVEAGCLALASCAMLARAAQQLPAASAFKIVAASGLALGPGTLLLTGVVQEADGANAQQVVGRLLGCCVGGVVTMLHGFPPHGAMAYMHGTLL